MALLLYPAAQGMRCRRQTAARATHSHVQLQHAQAAVSIVPPTAALQAKVVLSGVVQKLVIPHLRMALEEHTHAPVANRGAPSALLTAAAAARCACHATCARPASLALRCGIGLPWQAHAMCSCTLLSFSK